jgi:hypothetical protein
MYPTHKFAGSNSERQSVGLPGHCERCAQFGHVRAHKNLGCGDVGCDRDHPTAAVTDLAPIYDMLTACGFTRKRDTGRPHARWYLREVADTMITVAVYPRGNSVPAPAAPAPCVHLNSASLVPYWSNRWTADFHAGTPAQVVIAAISAAMKTAAENERARTP